MLHEKKGNTYFYKFDSLSEVVDETLKASKPYWGLNWDVLKSDYFIGRKFNSYKEVAEAVNTYWKEGMQTVDNMLIELQQEKLAPPKNIRRQAAWSEDAGDELCLDRLRTMQPYWRTTKRAHRPGPVNVTIITDSATPGLYSSEDILWRGAAGICLTTLLEQSGYRVELWSAQHLERTFTKPGSFVSCFLLKGPQDYLDQSTLVNAVSGWFHRTIDFASRCVVAQPSHGLGGPRSLFDVKDWITPDAQCIIAANLWSKNSAIHWVREQLAKFETGAFQLKN